LRLHLRSCRIETLLNGVHHLELLWSELLEYDPLLFRKVLKPCFIQDLKPI